MNVRTVKVYEIKNRMRKKFVKVMTEERREEIKYMTDKELVYSLYVESGWYYIARNEIKTEIAKDLYEDLELLKIEILLRMQKPPNFYQKSSRILSVLRNKK